MLGIGGVCLLLIAYVAGQVRGGMRDRVLAILVLGVFVMFFWAAFEQAGNVLNVWADKHTDRYLTEPTPAADRRARASPRTTPKAEGEQPARARRHLAALPHHVPPRSRAGNKPDRAGASGCATSFNPVPTAWFQSINALAIFVLAPLFAWLWVWLDRAGWQPSIPMKMFLGLVLMSASVAVMIAAAKQEDQATDGRRSRGKLPAGARRHRRTAVSAVRPRREGRPRAVPRRPAYVRRGRRTPCTSAACCPTTSATAIIEQTAPEAFLKKVEELQEDIADDRRRRRQVGRGDAGRGAARLRHEVRRPQAVGRRVRRRETQTLIAYQRSPRRR